MINRIFIFTAIFLFFTVANARATVINAVTKEENVLKIQLTEKTEYKFFQEEPFKIKIELKNTKPGVLDKKILFHEGLISEVSAQTQDNSTIVEILLAEPAKTEVKMEGDVLFVSFHSDTTAKLLPKKVVRIIDLSMSETEKGFEISIQGDSELPEPSITKADGYFSLAFSDVELHAQPSEKIPLSIKRQGDELILSFSFGNDFDVEALYLVDEILLDVKRVKKDVVKLESVKPQIIPEAHTVSLDLQDADIVGVLRLLGDISGYNIVIHPEVKGKITLKLINVPWTQVLDIVCKTFHLEKVVERNIIRILPIKVFQEEKKLEAETKELFKIAEEEQTQTFVLKYASVDKIKSTIEASKILSPKGNISTDDRTKTLIVRDTPLVLSQVAFLIQELDEPVTQILLEARIIEISSEFAKSFGFEWGIDWRADPRTTITGKITLPVGTGMVTAPTTEFTIGYLDPARTLTLDLKISALEQSGRGKIISTPKIITLDNKKAKIVQGESIPYGERDREGNISTKFKDVAITAEITPYLIDETSMLLDVNIIKEDLIAFVDIGGVFAPRTLKVEGVTKVFLKDGETLVIGGMFKETDRLRESKVPVLGDIPLVGELFKSRGRDELLYEVMIFITPRVLKL